MSKRKKPQRNYTEADLKEALEEVKRGRSTRQVAKEFGIPKTTLLYKKVGKLEPTIVKPGPECILGSADEERLIEWIFYMNRHGFPITKTQLFDSVQLLLNTMKKKTSFKNNRPGRRWFENFRARHPELTQRIAQKLTSARAAVTEEKLRSWFEEIGDYFKSKNLLEIDGSRIFNCDESAIHLSPNEGKVLANRADKTTYSFSANDEKECITTLICGNAAGELAPPMIMYKYQRIPKAIVQSVPKIWGIGRSENGWMTGETFFEWVANVFYPWLVKNKTVFPIVLFLDGHVSHLTYTLSTFCREHQIEVVALYPNATHILQPLDVAIFHPLKEIWKKVIQNWRMENFGSRVTREDFAPLFEKALNRLNCQDILPNGFRTTGLHPFSADAINYSKFFKTDKVTSLNTAGAAQAVDGSRIRVHLKFIEGIMDKEVLKNFEKHQDAATWPGPLEAQDLFDFWRKVKKMADASDQNMPTTSGVSNESSTTQALDEKQDEMINNEEKKVGTAKEENDRVMHDSGVIAQDCNDEKATKSRETDPILVYEVTADGELILTDEILENLVVKPEMNEGRELFEEKATVIEKISSSTPKKEDHLKKDENFNGKVENVKSSVECHPDLSQGDHDNDQTTKNATSSLNLQVDESLKSDVSLDQVTEDIKTDQEAQMSVSPDFKEKDPTPADIPSPFKKCLYFPMQNKKATKKTRKPRERMPSAITSEACMAYYEAKKQKEEELQKRKELKAIEKLQKAEEKRVHMEMVRVARQLKKEEREAAKKKRIGRGKAKKLEEEIAKVKGLAAKKIKEEIIEP